MDLLLKNEELAVFRLRKIYESYGYSQFKMSKFEEYDFYVKNKDFLTSGNIITFTDTNGKLMALKPDVTLSIVKNGKDEDGLVQKVYYSENVYRVTKSSRSFREITQTGLECVGDLDDYCISEVLTLAKESLAAVSDEYVLDISHMGILSEVIEKTGVSPSGRKEILECVKCKNVKGAEEVCQKEGIPKEKTESLKEIMTYGDKPSVILPKLFALLKGTDAEKYVKQLGTVLAPLSEDNLRIDFSVLNDMKYYNGIVFSGFICGVPSGILSGGQYDLLMKKMGRKAGAIGFALCPEELGEGTGTEFDVDEAVLYDETVSVDRVAKEMERAIKEGKRVRAVKALPDSLRYRELTDLTKGGNK